MDDVTVLVSGFDGWAVLWLGFCHFWHKYWPDCPWPLKVMVNRRAPPCGQAVRCGQNANWTIMMRNALQQVETKYLLLVLVDYWLARPVETETIREFAGHLERYGAQHIRLQRSDRDVEHALGPFEPDPRLFVFAPYAPYRASLQAGLWNAHTLAGLLHGRESPWEFETNASFRSARYVNALCIDRATTPDQWCNNAYFCYHNVVSRGRWRDKPIGDALRGEVEQYIAEHG